MIPRSNQGCPMVPRGTGVPRVGHTEFVPVLALTQARELTREFMHRIMFRGGLAVQNSSFYEITKSGQKYVGTIADWRT